MKISDNTVSVLKNFASINKSVLIKPGNVLSTISTTRSVMAKVVVTDSFEKQFAIGNLQEFLGALSLFDAPDIEFFDTYMKITSGRQSVRYFYADESSVVAPPDKELQLPSVDAEFELTADDINRVMKALGVLHLGEIVITGEDNTVYVNVSDTKNKSGHSFSIAVGVTDRAFKAIINAENLKLINDTYNVSISSKGIVKFASKTATYYIAVEARSTFS